MPTTTHTITPSTTYEESKRRKISEKEEDVLVVIDYQEADEELFDAGHGSRGRVILVLPGRLNPNSCLQSIVKDVFKKLTLFFYTLEPVNLC